MTLRTQSRLSASVKARGRPPLLTLRPVVMVLVADTKNGITVQKDNLKSVIHDTVSLVTDFRSGWVTPHLHRRYRHTVLHHNKTIKVNDLGVEEEAFGRIKVPKKEIVLHYSINVIQKYDTRKSVVTIQISCKKS
ncbi:uncharacterized protein RHIMIDRAFT_242983 [Rhizopus microsporus ATCC 52813]|uniref:Uncharacterized protein n=1 Tax=Rhizopus microsporus ATCC 52813 TaxID=1340429 RepID=A0A2G4SEB1_RHIZD|nr:uncharacterized protein RHIMIDRAFT_242983 [Rhizopus microsporus ATCC 52813]PHZ07164.1 hypothetical protein RHIMIDRAFT_242983 [Rhizopus microsporus ATCC 52813]